MTWPRRSKFGSTFTEVDGIKFRSKREAVRYTELKLLQQAGQIVSLYLQPSFDLHAPETVRPIGRYVADFSYTDARNGEVIVEDVKGFKTPLYQWKKKHAEAEHGIQIREV